VKDRDIQTESLKREILVIWYVPKKFALALKEWEHFMTIPWRFLRKIFVALKE
jgi:hypothetical protein